MTDKGIGSEISNIIYDWQISIVTKDKVYIDGLHDIIGTLRRL